MAAQLEVEISAITDKLKKGIDGAVLSLGQLEKEALGINKALETATDPREIIRLNNALEQTKAAMVNLRTAGLQPLTRATSNYNSIGIEFSRIIQDAPFGIIGVGNNITQLVTSFQNLRTQSASTGAALKTAFASIISPTNLLVLGVSALTTAFTLYAQSARSTKGPIDDLKNAQDSYNESLKETDRLLGREVLTQFLKEVGLIQQQNVGGRLIDIPTFTSASQVIDALSGKIENLRKGELDLLAKFLKTEIAEATRDAANNAGTFAEELASQDIELYNGLLAEVNKQLAFYKDETNKSVKATNDLQIAINSFSTNPLVDAYFEAIRKGAEFRKTLENAASALTGREGERPQIFDAGIELPNKPPQEDRAEELPFLDKLLEDLNEKIPTIEERLRTFAFNVQDILRNEIALSFEDLGLSIGEALASGGNVIEAIGQSLLRSIGAFLGQLGKQLIAFGTAGLAFGKLSLALTNPLTAIKAAPLAIAAGVALTIAAGAIGAIGRQGLGGTGGGVGGSVAQSQTFGGTGAFTNPNDFLSNVVFEIEGTRLVGVLQRTQDRYATG